MKKLFLLSLLLILGSLHPVSAQDAFERISFKVTGTKLFSGNELMRSWSPSAGIGFEVSTPSYFGNLEAGIRYVRYDELDFENSGFHSHYVFGGWYYSYLASPELTIEPGIRLGNRFMLHDEDKFYDDYRFSREESEFTYEAYFRIQQQIGTYSGIYVSVSYNRTVFNIPYSSIIGTIGFSTSFNSPSWLKRFLR